jgi:hypothetical protein
MTLGDAFVELWQFVEGLGLDQPVEEDLKQVLCALGKAVAVPEQLLNDRSARQDELEARFFLQMKYGEVES